MVYKELHEISVSNFGFNIVSKHNINTRNSNKLKNAHHRTNYFCQSVTHCGIKFYNMLPEDIIDSRSLCIFKHKLLDWLKNTDFKLDSIILPHRFR